MSPLLLASALSPVKLTASLNVCALTVVIFAPMLVEPPAFVIKLFNADDPPTTPPNEVIPEVFNTRSNAPFNVEPNPILPLPLDAKVPAPVNETASLNVCAPVVEIFDAMLVEPPALVVKLAKALDPPIAAPKRVTPLELTVKACPPLTVELN